MLNLIQTEFLKLRRRTFIWLMLFAACFMPIVGIFYFKAINTEQITPIKFYKWTALSYASWVILPIVLGILCTMLMYEEKQNDLLKQFWMIPISKRGYFFSKLAVVFLYSIGFMLITAVASVLSGVLSGLIVITKESLIFLIIKCLEIGALTPLAMMPVLAVAASQKGYILPVCVTIIYTFLGFILLMVSMYFHPLSGTTAIVLRNVDGVILNEPVNIGKAILCISIWMVVSTLGAEIMLRKGN